MSFGHPSGAECIPRSCSRSARLTPEVETRARISPGPGIGLGTSFNDKVPTSPWPSMTTARMLLDSLMEAMIGPCTASATRPNTSTQS